MKISRLQIKNFKCFDVFEVNLLEDVTVFVGNNETGKSTILEALNLVLTGKLNGRSAFTELTTSHFNKTVIAAFLAGVRNVTGEKPAPPQIAIEVTFVDDNSETAKFRGKFNSRREDLSGVTFTVGINDEDYGPEYVEYISDPDAKTIPIEYYNFEWLSFAGDKMSPSKLRLDTCLIDASAIRNERA